MNHRNGSTEGKHEKSSSLMPSASWEENWAVQLDPPVRIGHRKQGGGGAAAS